MAYVRRTRRGRAFRRGRRTLSTRNIFGNKSSRAQAKQISALSKRIRAVARKCNPETKLVDNPGYYENRAFMSPNVTDQGGVQFLWYPVPMPGVGVGDNQRIGNKITLKPISLFNTVQYQEFFDSLESGFSTVNIPLNSNGIQLRVVALQALQAAETQINQNSIDLKEIFEYDAVSQGNGDPIAYDMMMRMPFRTGITAEWKILMDKRITVTKDKPFTSRRLKIKPSIRSVVWKENDQAPRGQIYLLVLSAGWDYNRYIPSGGDAITDYNQCSFTWSFRVPYTDA